MVFRRHLFCLFELDVFEPGHPRYPWSSSRRCRPRLLLHTSWTSCRGITVSLKSNSTTFWDDLWDRRERFQNNVRHGVLTVSHAHTLSSWCVAVDDDVVVVFFTIVATIFDEKNVSTKFYDFDKKKHFPFIFALEDFLTKREIRTTLFENLLKKLSFFLLFLFFMQLFCCCCDTLFSKWYHSFVLVRCNEDVKNWNWKNWIIYFTNSCTNQM